MLDATLIWITASWLWGLSCQVGQVVSTSASDCLEGLSPK